MNGLQIMERERELIGTSAVNHTDKLLLNHGQSSAEKERKNLHNRAMALKGMM